MTEKTKKALSELLRQLLSALVAFVTALLATSCGSTVKAVVTNGASGTTTSVSVTTSNPSTVTVSPSVNTDVNPKNQSK